MVWSRKGGRYRVVSVCVNGCPLETCLCVCACRYKCCEYVCVSAVVFFRAFGSLNDVTPFYIKINGELSAFYAA